MAPISRACDGASAPTPSPSKAVIKRWASARAAASGSEVPRISCRAASRVSACRLVDSANRKLPSTVKACPLANPAMGQGSTRTPRHSRHRQHQRQIRGQRLIARSDHLAAQLGRDFVRSRQQKQQRVVIEIREHRRTSAQGAGRKLVHRQTGTRRGGAEGRPAARPTAQGRTPRGRSAAPRRCLDDSRACSGRPWRCAAA